MKVVIVQSAYLPWSGYFNLINDTDIFVFLDSVQWTKRDWRNRNRIRTPVGWSWLTIPVKLKKAYYKYRVCDVVVDNSQDWQYKHLEMLKNSYKKAPYFDEIYNSIKDILNKRYKYVVDINYKLIFWVSNYLNLRPTKFLFSQKMQIPGELKKTDRLIWILEKIGHVNYYISGPKAKSYMEQNKFEEKKIKIIWHNYEPPYYNQNIWKSNIFISSLSVIDLLFNYGKESLKIIVNQEKIKKPGQIKVMLP